MVVVCWWMMSFSMLINFHTSLVLNTRPAGSDGAKASPLRVRFRLSMVALASRFPSVKLAMILACLWEVARALPRWVRHRLGISFRSVHETTNLYHNNLNHNVHVVVFSSFSWGPPIVQDLLAVRYSSDRSSDTGWIEISFTTCTQRFILVLYGL
jgi:hypothetical protein